MPENNPYDPTVHGDYLVKASAMEAAFTEYHRKYLEDRGTSTMHYKGSVTTRSLLPTTGQVAGDVWNIADTGENVAWDGEDWDEFGSLLDLSNVQQNVNIHGTLDVSDRTNNGAVVSPGDISASGDIEADGDISAGGEVSATETVTQGGQSTTVTHNLTDKLDADDYHRGITWGEANDKFTWGDFAGTSTGAATYTSELNLKKPGNGTQIDIADINNNMDIIDAAHKIQVAARSLNTGTSSATSVNQLSFKDNTIWKNLDEVRVIDNAGSVLYCNEGTSPGLLLRNSQVQIAPVTWNAGVPAIGTVSGYVGADGNYHSANYDLETLGDSVNNSALKTQAIKNITRSGTTFTATRCDNTTFTFTQQDNNTTYSNATTSTAGLMSATDKSKVNGLNNLSVSVWSSVPNAAQLNIPMLSGGKTLKIYFKHGTGTSIALE